MNEHRPPRTMTAQEFDQDTGRAKALAASGPVTIIEGSGPAYVLMTQAEYAKLEELKPDEAPAPREPAPFRSLLETLADPNYRDDEPDLMDFIPPRDATPIRDPFENDE